MSALKIIYKKLQNGEIFGKIEPHRMGGTYFWDVLWAYNIQAQKYICWRHFGESANKFRLTDLKWVIEVIFRTTPEQFLFDYTTYSEWKRIDKCYSNDMHVE